MVNDSEYSSVWLCNIPGLELSITLSLSSDRLAVSVMVALDFF